MKRVFITGVSSGIGYELAKLYLSKGYRVSGLSRRDPHLDGLHWINVDISDFNQIETLNSVGDIEFDLIILNAGVLGELKTMRDTPLDEIQSVMNINVWANKLIIDKFKYVKQIVAISSGASVNGNRGWSGYSLSKATLNMLIKLYSTEQRETHFSAVAPGLIETPMLNRITTEFDEVKFPSVKRLKESQKQSPRESAELLADLFPKLLDRESGEYIDVRHI